MVKDILLRKISWYPNSDDTGFIFIVVRLGLWDSMNLIKVFTLVKFLISKSSVTNSAYLNTSLSYIQGPFCDNNLVAATLEIVADALGFVANALWRAKTINFQDKQAQVFIHPTYQKR